MWVPFSRERFSPDTAAFLLRMDGPAIDAGDIEFIARHGNADTVASLIATLTRSSAKSKHRRCYCTVPTVHTFRPRRYA